MCCLLFRDTVERNLSLGKYRQNTIYNNRRKSWLWCRKIFYESHKTQNIDNDLLALNLAFYLASFGMYRGSSPLLFNDYKVHNAAVKEILKNKYSDLWNIDPFTYKVNSLPEWFWKNSGGLRDIYNELKSRTVYQKKDADNKCFATNTLVTKVLLGTIGCVPAYDEYFVSGLRYFGIKNDFSKKSLQNIISVLSPCREVHDCINEYTKEEYGYVPMKIIDSYFWEIGYLSKLLESLQSSSENISQTKLFYIKNYIGCTLSKNEIDREIIKDCLSKLLPNKNFFKK